MKAFIYDIGTAGHLLNYVFLISKALKDHGVEVFLVTEENTICSNSYHVHYEGKSKPFQIIITKSRDSIKNLFLRRLIRMLDLKDVITRLNPDYVYIPYFDSYLKLYSIMPFILPKTKLNVILFNLQFVFMNKGSVRSFLLEKLFMQMVNNSSINRIYLTDDMTYEYIRRKTNALAFERKIRKVHDPVSWNQSVDRGNFRCKYGIPLNAKVLGSVGIQDRRKGVDILIKAFLDYSDNQNEYLLLAGEHSESVNQILESYHAHPRIGNVVTINSYLKDEQLDEAIGASDVISVIYPRHYGSASFLLRAALAGKPVIGSNFGWIGECIARYELGLTIDTKSVDQIRNGIKWVFTNPKMNREKAVALTEKHNYQNFSSCIVESICM